MAADEEYKPRLRIRMRTFVTKGRIPTQHDRFRGTSPTASSRDQAVSEINATIPVFNRDAGIAELGGYIARAGGG